MTLQTNQLWKFGELFILIFLFRFKEITPEGYVEEPFMFCRKGKYYFMWSKGNWTGPDYSLAYAIADSPMGLITRQAKVMQIQLTTKSVLSWILNKPTDDKAALRKH